MASYFPQCRPRQSRLGPPTDPNRSTASSPSTESSFCLPDINTRNSSSDGISRLVPAKIQHPDVGCTRRDRPCIWRSTLANDADPFAVAFLRNTLQSSTSPHLWPTVAFLTDRIVFSSGLSYPQSHMLPSSVGNAFFSTQQCMYNELGSYTTAENFCYPLSSHLISVEVRHLRPPLKNVCLQSLLPSFRSYSSLSTTHVIFKAVESHNVQQAVEILTFETPRRTFCGNVVKATVPARWPVPIGSIVPSGISMTAFEDRKYHARRCICHISLLPKRNKLEICVHSNGSCKITIRTLPDEVRHAKRRQSIHRAQFAVGERVPTRRFPERCNSLGISAEYPHYPKLKLIVQGLLRMAAASSDLTAELPPPLKVAAVTIFTAYVTSFRFLEWLAIHDISLTEGSLEKPFSPSVRIFEKSVPQVLFSLQTPVSLRNESPKMQRPLCSADSTVLCPLDGLARMDSSSLAHPVMRDLAAKGCRRSKCKVTASHKPLSIKSTARLQSESLETVSSLSSVSFSSAEATNRTVLPNRVTGIERALQGPICRHLEHKYSPVKDRCTFLCENLHTKDPVVGMELKQWTSLPLTALAQFRDSAVNSTSGGSRSSCAVKGVNTASVTRRRKFVFLDPLIQPLPKTEPHLIQNSNQSSANASPPLQGLSTAVELSDSSLKSADTSLGMASQSDVNTEFVVSDVLSIKEHSPCNTLRPFLGVYSDILLGGYSRQQQFHENSLGNENRWPAFQIEPAYCGPLDRSGDIAPAITNSGTRKTSHHPTGSLEQPSRGQIVLAYIDLSHDDELVEDEGGNNELGSHSCISSPILIPVIRKPTQFF